MPAMQNGLNILHLEDDRLDADLIRDTLTSQGVVANIVAVETEREFRASLLNGNIGLVLSDYALPGFDGMSALQIVREINAELPFIFVSGTIGEQIAIESLKNGATDYVLKRGLQRLGLSIQRALSEAKERQRSRRNDDALRNSEAGYKLLFESNPLPMWVFSLETLAFLAVNEAAIQHYGYSREEFLQMTVKDIRPPEDLPALLRDIHDARQGLDRTGTWRHQKKDGTIICVEIISHGLEFTGQKAEIVLANDVTDRRQALEALRESEQRKDAILRSSLDCIVTIDHEDKILEFNPAAESTFGYSSDCVIGRPMHELIIPPGLRERHRAGLARYIKTGETRIIGKRIEMSAIRADGSEFPAELTVTSIGDSSRPVFTAFIRDITDRKRAEAVLHETNQTLQTFIQASPLAIVALDMERKVRLWNPAAERFFGWTESEVIGQFLPTIPEEDLQNQLAMREQVLSSEGLPAISNLETRRLRKDGSIIQVSASYAPLLDTQGAIVGTIGIMADITERKLVEESRQSSELRYRRLFESAKDGILILDADSGQIVDVNPYLIAMLGFSKEQLAGKELWEIGAFKDIIASKLAFAELRQRGYIRYENLPLESREGLVRQVEFVSNTYLAGESHVIQCNIRDITESKLAEEELRRTNQHLEGALAQLQTKTHELASMTQQLWQASKLATMGELAASIAHELNNPLATISLHAEVLIAQLAADNPNRRSLLVIDQEVERMAALVSNLLLSSRRSHQQISSIKIDEELQNSLEFIHYHLRSHSITVATDFANDLPSVQADRPQVRQVFLNLLTNASDAMPEGGTLTVRARKHPLENGSAAVLIEFSDSGIGIEPEDVPKLWEPFFTTKSEGKGTGLGLPICRRTVEEHRGTIDIESQPGKGTTVRIILPAIEGGEFVKRD
jgi:PAS domain S-box-containing protein